MTASGQVLLAVDTRCEPVEMRSLKVFVEVAGSESVDVERLGPSWLLYFSAVLSAATDCPASYHAARPWMIARCSPKPRRRQDRRRLQPRSMIQNRRDLPGRILFTLGVAISTTCVALILIL
jgi:hypothetical protein